MTVAGDAGGSGSPQAPGRALEGGWRGLRDRLLGDPAFRRWAARFPLTRAIARRRAARAFDLVAGFVYSQVLAACVELDLLETLARGPQAVERLAARTDVPEEALRRLLDAAVAIDLLEWRAAGRVGLGSLGASLVGNAGVAAMVRHHRLLYDDLADPVALLRRDRAEAGGGALARHWPYATDAAPAAVDPDRVERYTALMAASQPLLAEQVLDAYDFRRHRRLLDIGGGDGTFARAAAARAPALDIVVFDLPAVAEEARRRFAGWAGGAGGADGAVEGRVTVAGGDFFRDPLPRGCDVATLVRVLHDHDDARLRVLLRAAHDALVPGGTLVVAEPMAGTRGARAMGDAYFGFYLLAMGSGRPRSAARLGELLADAGFGRVREAPTAVPLQTRVLVAHRTL